jgi:hypothetical protein
MRMDTPSCECKRLEDLAIVPMGHHEDVFRTLERVRERGSPWWWLYASKCRECRQIWLVAQEERHNDLFILRRLDQAVSSRLLQDGVWPADFDRYETLLEIGRDAGHSVRFFDVADSPLLHTIIDLARERPGIRVSELASLLNLEPTVAGYLARQAIESMGVKITLDSEG